MASATRLTLTLGRKSQRFCGSHLCSSEVKNLAGNSLTFTARLSPQHTSASGSEKENLKALASGCLDSRAAAIVLGWYQRVMVAPKLLTRRSCSTGVQLTRVGNGISAEQKSECLPKCLNTDCFARPLPMTVVYLQEKHSRQQSLASYTGRTQVSVSLVSCSELSAV